MRGTATFLTFVVVLAMAVLGAVAWGADKDATGDQAAAKAAPAAGRAYYVSATGDDAAAGSAEKPWNTLAKALASVQPGETIELAAGSYEFVVPKKAFEGKMVTVRAKADAAGKVVLKGDVSDNTGKCSFLRFEGLDIRSCVRFENEKWTQFVRCKFSGQSHWGVAFLESEHVGLYGCTIVTDTGSQCMIGGGRYFEYRYNEIPGGSSDAFQGHCDDLLIEGNWVHDIKPGPEAHADGIQLGNCRGITVRGNVFDVPPTMQTFFFAWTAKEKTYEDIVIENNVCTTAQIHPLTVGPSTSMVVRNNIFVPGPGVEYNNGIIETGGAKGKVTFQNNMICLLAMKVRPEDTASNNIYLKCPKNMAGPGMLGSQVAIEDLFVNRDIRDYRLKDGSPAIGAAAPGSWPALDILGRERPKEKACIGPIEKLPGDDKPFMDLWRPYFARMQAEVRPPDPPQAKAAPANPADGRARPPAAEEVRQRLPPAVAG
jgi:hypothetical protein